MPMPRWNNRRMLGVAMLLALVVATLLRVLGLSELPVGLHYDEAANGILAAEIASGLRRPVFISSYTGKEVLFFYWAASWMRLIGPSVYTLRLASACIGVCSAGAAAWVTYELLHGRRGVKWIAVLTTIFVATSFWHLILTRYGFRAGTQPLLQALTIASLWRGLRLRHKGWLAVAGLFCGATAYTYLAARVFPVVLACAFVVLLVADRGHRKERLAQMSLFGLVALIVLTPLLAYFISNPGAFSTRISQVAAGSLNAAVEGIISCLGMFFLEGDPYIRFNIPGRPVFDLVTAALFLHGCLVILLDLRGLRKVANGVSNDPQRALRHTSRVFLFSTLLVMILPSALATGDITPSNLRAVGLLPFVYIFPAVSLESLVAKLATLREQRWIDPTVLRFRTAVIVLAVLALLASWEYFGLWASSSALYNESDGALVDVASYLDEVDLNGLTPYVGGRHYRHPTLAFVSRAFPMVKWIVGGNSLVVPSEGDGLLILPRGADAALEWAEGRVVGWSLLTEQDGPDGNRAFRVYRVPAGTSYVLPESIDANFGHVISLQGFELLSPARSGGAVEALFLWRVNSPIEQPDLLPIARVVDTWGGVWGETRPFHYPSEQWAPGDLWLDRMSIPVDPGAPPGDYVIQLGFYAQSDGTVLPVLDEAGSYAGSAAQIPVTVGQAGQQTDMDSLDIRTRMDASTELGLTLLGANLDSDQVLAGEPVYLTLFWQADRGSLQDLDIRVSLGDVVLSEGPPVHGTYPTDQWEAGDVIADRYDARVNREENSGEFPVLVELIRDGGVSVFGPVEVGRITVEATDREFEIPTLQYPVEIRLGDQVELLGYDLQLEPSEDRLIVTLYWRALTEMDVSYTVFNHLLDPDGSAFAYHDGIPAEGGYPTTLWITGEVVTDRHEIDLPEGLSPGIYEWEVGLYVSETGDRLAVPGAVDGAIHLQVTYQP